MLKLLDLLGIQKSELKQYKIHFAIGARHKLEPYEKFLIDGFQDWQERQTQRNFSREYVLSLIYAGKNTWLFGGVYKILPVKPTPIKENTWSGWKYESELVNIQTEFIGRVLISYKKEFRQSYPNLELKPRKGLAPSEMLVSEILRNKVSIADFKGFDNTNISYETLKNIVSNQITSWKTALSNVKGIYLITDKKTGKHYVGSAYGDDCLWQRWQAYSKDGHGGNIELKTLLQKYGNEYKYNFKYSILEICNMNVGSDYIISRETYWKEVLLTRKFGLNKN